MGFFNKLGEIAQGIIGIKEKSLLGDIPLEIITEKSRTISSTVTNKRVEKGFNISDTARKEVVIFNITVLDNSLKRNFNRQLLEEMVENGEPVTFYYAGRDLYENIVVESIEEIEDSTLKNCLQYYIVLKQIEVSEIKASDSKIDYKKANSTGGSKHRNSASIKTPTSKETQKAEKAVEKSALKNIF